MLRKIGFVVLVVVVVALVAVGVYAQAERGAMGAGGGRGPGLGAGGAGMLIERLGLTAPEKAAVAKAMDAKQRDRQSLRTNLDRLQTVADRKEATNPELKRAVAEFLAARDRVVKREALADQTLMKSLSPRAQAKCLAAGVISNGVGFGVGMGGRRGGGMGGMGGGRGPGGPMPGPQ